MGYRDDYLPPAGQNTVECIGAALREYARSAWPVHTAKTAAAKWGLDTETGRNVTKGHAGVRALARAIQVEGYDVLDAVGEAITGLSRAEWELRKLQQMQQGLKDATMEYEAIVARASALEDLLPSRKIRPRVAVDDLSENSSG